MVRKISKRILEDQKVMDYFIRRETTIHELDKERAKIAQHVLSMIPKELYEYNSKHFHDFFYDSERMAGFLQTLYDQRQSNPWPGLDKIKDFEDYGFKNKTDALRKMRLLKKAWKGIIDVDLDPSDWYLTVRYRLASAGPE